MATGSVLLTPASAQPPDGTTSNAAPAIQTAKGSAAAPSRFSLVAAFDPATVENLWWAFQLPANYASGGTLRLLWEANATTGSVVWGASVGATTAADVDTPVEHAQAAAATVTTAANTTEARRLVESTVMLTMDSAAANDLVVLRVYRDAANASDTVSVDATLWSVMLDYTTS
jgi:hypothetical protein